MLRNDDNDETQGKKFVWLSWFSFHLGKTELVYWIIYATGMVIGYNITLR